MYRLRQQDRGLPTVTPSSKRKLTKCLGAQIVVIHIFVSRKLILRSVKGAKSQDLNKGRRFWNWLPPVEADSQHRPGTCSSLPAEL